MLFRKLRFMMMAGIILTGAFIGLTSCARKEPEKKEEIKNGYTKISQEEAMKMMERDDGHIIVDVRSYDEYNEGHIANAVCIPNETIADDPVIELPDKEQIILVYCQSGNRSKQAAQKLADLGYVNVYEFGGLNDWEGEIVTEFNYPIHRPELVVEVNDRQMTAVFADNTSADAFIKKLDEERSITITMHDYGSFEKVGDLPWNLPTNDEEIKTQAGDIILYQGDKISIYYDENTWNFTRLAKIIGFTQNELKELLGEGDVTVSFFVDHLDY